MKDKKIKKEVFVSLKKLNLFIEHKQQWDELIPVSIISSGRDGKSIVLYYYLIERGQQ